MSLRINLVIFFLDLLPIESNLENKNVNSKEYFFTPF